MRGDSVSVFCLPYSVSCLLPPISYLLTSASQPLIIGAGHNGLIAAFYLARAGYKPLVLEARSMVGGAAVTEEIAPGHRCPTLAHSTGPLRPSIVADMQLSRRVEFLRPDPRLVALSPDGRPLVLSNDVARVQRKRFARTRPTTPTRYPDFCRDARAAGRIPPAACSSRRRRRSISPAAGDLGTAEDRTALPQARAHRRVPAAAMDADGGRRSRRRMVHGRSAPGRRRRARHLWRRGRSVVGRHRRGAAAERGDRSGPRRQHDRGQGRTRRADRTRMADAAREAGATIRLDAPVARIAGPRTAGRSGVVLRGRLGGSGSRGDLECRSAPDAARRSSIRSSSTLAFCSGLRNYRMPGTVAKVNLTLGALPPFIGVANPARSARPHPHRTEHRLPREGVSTRRSTARSPPSRTSTSPFRRCSIPIAVPAGPARHVGLRAVRALQARCRHRLDGRRAISWRPPWCARWSATRPASGTRSNIARC